MKKLYSPLGSTVGVGVGVVVLVGVGDGVAQLTWKIHTKVTYLVHR